MFEPDKCKCVSKSNNLWPNSTTLHGIAKRLIQVHHSCVVERIEAMMAGVTDDGLRFCCPHENSKLLGNRAAPKWTAQLDTPKVIRQKRARSELRCRRRGASSAPAQGGTRAPALELPAGSPLG